MSGPERAGRQRPSSFPAAPFNPTPCGPRARALDPCRSTTMPEWLSLLCGVLVIVAAAYLLYVILRPEDF